MRIGSRYAFSLLLVASMSLLASACGDDITVNAENTDNGGDDDNNGGNNTGGTTTPERSRPDRTPTAESTPTTPSEERETQAADRPSREEAPERESEGLPAEATDSGDDALIELLGEYLLYCEDTCDIGFVCDTEVSEDAWNACFASCSNDLSTALENLDWNGTTNELQLDCLDAAVEAMWCETDLGDDIATVCEEWGGGTVASENCQPEYEDLVFWCEDYPGFADWFFTLATFGPASGGGTDPDPDPGTDPDPDPGTDPDPDPGTDPDPDPGTDPDPDPGTDPADDFTADIEAELAAALNSCQSSCESGLDCGVLDDVSFDECLANCEDSYADTTTSGTEDELLCAEAIANAESCAEFLSCDELSDLYNLGEGCDFESDAVDNLCGASAP